MSKKVNTFNALCCTLFMCYYQIIYKERYMVTKRYSLCIYYHTDFAAAKYSNSFCCSCGERLEKRTCSLCALSWAGPGNCLMSNHSGMKRGIYNWREKKKYEN